MKKVILFSLFALATSSLFANAFKSTIKNIKQPSNTNNVIEFDVYVQSTSEKELRFQSFQAGINFNYDGLANGGIITGEFVPNSCDASLKGKQTTPNWNVNQETKQIRLLAAIQTTQNNAVVIPSDKDGIKIGTFRLTNTVPFATATPNFTWSFNPGKNITRTVLTSFVDQSSIGQSLTTQKTFAYETQGPEYFVTENPVINASKPSSTTTAVLNKNIKVYPNPVVDVLTVSIAAMIAQKTSIQLVDNSGRIVKNIETQVTAGNNDIDIDTQNLATGAYQVQVIQDGKVTLNEQIIKQ